MILSQIKFKGTFLLSCSLPNEREGAGNQRSSKQTGQQRNNSGADQRDAAAGHQLLDALGLRAGIVVAVAFEQVYQTPDAEAGTDSDYHKNLVVTKANNTISQVQDDTYYQSAAMTVSATPSDDLVNFTVSVSGVETAFVVDEEGNRKDTFAPGDKFYVRVPTKDITSEAGKVTVTVKGKFNNYLSGSYFTSENLQKVVVVTGTENYETASLVIDFVGTPDTGMSKSQTVFFIGLIVLLCGIGIIYANSKPVEVQS